MNTLLSPCNFLVSLPYRPFCPSIQTRPPYSLPVHHRYSRQSSIRYTVPSNEESLSVINFEELAEKDFSFLESYDLSTNEEVIARIISAGEIKESSRVLVSIGSEEFIDRLVNTSPCKLLLVVHDSLFSLACIKEKFDIVKCWQGELIYVPEKWAPLDVVFIYFLPGLPFQFDQILQALAKHCSPGAKLIISHTQGRSVLMQQRKQYPDVIVSDLPDKNTLVKAAEDNFFEVAEFVDEPDFYLAVLTPKSS